MLTRHVALVSETDKIDAGHLAAVAAALQKQVTRDFAPIWGVHANVSSYARLEEVPLDYWPIMICDKLPRPDAAGYHEDDLGQPCALVMLIDDWSVTASHETLEMLVDPYGRHLIASQSPKNDGDRVRFLVEVSDPCSDESYPVNGIAVSDFYTPRYFDPVALPSVRYSFTGAIKEPREVLKGGYLTWHDLTTKTWWHRTWFTGGKPKDVEIPKPKLVQGGNIRAAIDRHVRETKGDAKRRIRRHGTGHKENSAGKVFGTRAERLREALGLSG